VQAGRIVEELMIAFRTSLLSIVAALLACWPQSGRTDDLKTYSIELKDHGFSPPEVHVPAGQPFLVVVKNSTGQSDEFEMLIPFVEHGVEAGAQTQFLIRPLRPGRFPFFGESDPDNEKGAFVSE
jgi:hypothetical protein